MIKALTFFLAAFALIFVSSSAFAFDTPARPDNGWYIRDDAGKLSLSDIYTLNQKIENFNKTTRNEIGVLITPTLAGDSIEDAAYYVFNKWGIGKRGLDNGILIMIAANDHKMRIETGKGSEGDVPDAITMQITAGMKPYLRTNDYTGAVNSAVNAITKVMEDRTGQKPIVDTTVASEEHSTNSDGYIGALVVFGFFIVIGFISLIIWLFDIARRKHEQKLYRSDDDFVDNKTDSYFPPSIPPLTYSQTKTTTTHTKPAKKHERSSSSSSSSSSYSSSSSSSSDSGSGFSGGSSGGGGSSDGW